MFDQPAPVRPLHLHEQYSVDVLRLDLLHPEVSGNKWFKLKYSLAKAREQGFSNIITFGGAFSNHLAATAAACKLLGFSCTGMVRGEDSAELNPTLSRAKENGMQLHFVSREVYKQKHTEAYKRELLQCFGRHYLVPEGGNTAEGMRGCMEIVPAAAQYDHILCACGTGTTFAGIFAAAPPGQVVTGISVLKGENTLPREASLLLKEALPAFNRPIAGNEELEKELIAQSSITNAYCFKGYARYDQKLAEFKKAFEQRHDLPLDHVYTVKLFYALSDLVAKKKFLPGSRILVVHSGGLQGNEGFEAVNDLNPAMKV